MEEKEINPSSFVMEKNKARPPEHLNCPRCKSSNTKFCYYNNYSLSQPRYFCKTCRRYWTEGGSLRNVPVGGGSRKNRKLPTGAGAAPSSSTTTTTDHHHYLISTCNNSMKLQDYYPPPQFPIQNSSARRSDKYNIFDAGKDLNLAFPSPISHSHQQHHHIVDQVLPNKVENNDNSMNSCDQISALDLLRGCGSIGSRGGLSSFIPNLMPDSNADDDLDIINNNNNNPYPNNTGFHLAPDDDDQIQVLKPTTLGISVDDGIGVGVGIGRPYGDGRNFLPNFEELNQHQQSLHPNQADQNERHGNSYSTSTGYLDDEWHARWRGGGGGHHCN